MAISANWVCSPTHHERIPWFHIYVFKLKSYFSRLMTFHQLSLRYIITIMANVVLQINTGVSHVPASHTHFLAWLPPQGIGIARAKHVKMEVPRTLTRSLALWGSSSYPPYLTSHWLFRATNSWWFVQVDLSKKTTETASSRHCVHEWYALIHM